MNEKSQYRATALAEARKKWFESKADAVELAKKAKDEHSPKKDGGRLREAREAVGFSLQDVQDLSGGMFTRSSLSLIELGGQRMTVEQAVWLDALYQCGLFR